MFEIQLKTGGARLWILEKRCLETAKESPGTGRGNAEKLSGPARLAANNPFAPKEDCAAQ